MNEYFYMKAVNLDEVYNFLLLSFSFVVIKMLKKLTTYLHLMVFLTFHTCGLTPLEPNLTAVGWRAKNIWSSGVEVR